MLLCVRQTASHAKRSKLSMVGWLNGVLRRFQRYFSHNTATVQIINVFPRVSPVLGWGSEVPYPRTLPQKNPESHTDPKSLSNEESYYVSKNWTDGQTDENANRANTTALLQTVDGGACKLSMVGP